MRRLMVRDDGERGAVAVLIALSLVVLLRFADLAVEFSGNSSLQDTFRNTSPVVPSAFSCTGNCRGIIGSFVKYVSLADGYSLGPVNAFGAAIARLTN